MMASQTYHPLTPETREIRLFSLEPGSSSDDIHIRLHHHCLSTEPRPRYEALSYVWGSSQHHNPIHIRQQSGQTQQLLITQNLFVALTQLRHERSTRDLWVDAICIDQNNFIERSHQVAMMGDIYRCATRVVAWLGLEDNDSTYALQFMSELSSQITVNWLTNNVEFSATCKTNISVGGLRQLLMSRRQCEGVYHVLMRPWFERLWIIQEIALGSKNAILLCGEASIPWMDFVDAFLCIYCRVNRENFADVFPQFLARGSLVYKLAIMQNYGSLEHSRTQLAQSRCGDPRDKIYGILNILSRKDREIGIYPDYSKGVSDIFQNTASRWIKHHRQLNILNSCEMTPSPTNIPSWVPDWSTPLTFQPLWRRADKYWLEDDLLIFSFPTSRTLRVFGVACGTINGRYDFTGLRPGMDMRTFRDELRKILSFGLRVASGEHYQTGETMKEAICRTIVVNEFSEAHCPPKKALRRYQDCFRAIEELSEDAGSSFTQLYSDLVFQFSRGRCFFTTEEGYIGMVGSSAQIGDIVCDILRCDRPLLLRPIAEGPNICYKLVGECYIHGLMGHEAMFGEVPANYQQLFYYDEDEKDDRIGYLNRISEEIEKEDPRPRRQEVRRMTMSLRGTTGISELGEEHGLKVWRDIGVNITPLNIV
ncbi:heterokaryon incompatibility protein-domain-containing protein [Xylaria acuta]|nr:heterokaryon incompatibility protein-domain-containing protein [Xylaria acuta]